MRAEEVVGILLTLTAVSSYINHRYVKLPKSVGLTLITLLLSFVIAISGKFGWDLSGFSHELLEGIGFNETFLHGMLGFLLFAGSLHVNRMELAKHKTIVGLLATVSVALSTFIIGFTTFGLTQFLGIEIPLEYCLVFGALISPTDAITTLGILKVAKAPKAYEIKIAGEALFNDGMGIVLFIILLGLASGAEKTWSIQSATLFFIQQGLGGIILGLVMGWLAGRLLRTIDNSEVAIILTLGMVAGGYSFAHSVMQVSGAICMAMAGLVVGGSLQHGNMSKETILRLDTFWKLLDEVLNAILFVTLGLEFLTLNFTSDIGLAAVGAIVIVIAARWISVMVPVAWVSLFRKFGPNVVLLMTWGGLRGGISIALALTIPHGPIRDFIVAITYVVVLFSILVQGLTMGSLVRRVVNREQPKPSMQAVLISNPGKEIIYSEQAEDAA
jgi:CPA1 family monovalent cation:H+ antiporter